MSSRARSERPRLTPFHQRISAEALTARGGGGASRLAPALAHSSVDLNPHQIEAAAFALASLPTGGAVLADEVGLGKTVEAGLVLAQLAAEGKGRAVILVPASLRAQWRDELSSKFGLDAVVVDGDSVRAAERHGLKTNPFDTGGIVICSHPFAAMRAAELERVPWDVAVIDEAHRLRNAYRRDHRTGQALRRGLRKCPKLLLTATPLQNDLMELLGLAAFIDDALLGNEEAFRLQYAQGELDEDKAADLKARLAPVVVRTLRRQVKEYVKFTARRSIVEDFAPTAEEQALYDRVSEYLRREDAQAIPQARRALFVLVYRKILASSSFALAATLDRLADSLEGKLAGAECAAQADLLLDADGFSEEAEELFDDGRAAPRRSGPPAVRAMRDELSELRACAKLARGIKTNAKAEALVRGLDRCFTVAKACGWPEKAVVFTEFRRTQDHLAKLLASKGYSVTCLSGDVSGTDKRQALVEEFRSTSQILLMTEAGAEGLNLQFCNLVVN
ncbi:MAG TPA: DEAD/DEAH box helicase, partial [Anaeromyxobacter sp.]